MAKLADSPDQPEGEASYTIKAGGICVSRTSRDSLSSLRANWSEGFVVAGRLNATGLGLGVPSAWPANSTPPDYFLQLSSIVNALFTRFLLAFCRVSRLFRRGVWMIRFSCATVSSPRDPVDETRTCLAICEQLAQLTEE